MSVPGPFAKQIHKYGDHGLMWYLLRGNSRLELLSIRTRECHTLFRDHEVVEYMITLPVFRKK